VIIPVKNELHLEYAQNLAKELKLKGHRVRVDDRNESMGLKTRQAQTGKIPYMLVIGDKEMQTASVSVRKYGEQKAETMTNDQVFDLFKSMDAEKIPAKLRDIV
jgi:threonyl-tRNA synthetase